MFKGLKKLFKKHKEEKEEKEKKEKEEIIFSNKLISLIGPSSVGKTAFFKVFKGKQIEKYCPTVCIDLCSSQNRTFILVDTCGTIKFYNELILNPIIQRCHIFLYLYNDVPETYQLKTINQYIDIIKLAKEELAKKNKEIMNKLEEKCFFFMLEIKRRKEENNININIDETIEELNKLYSSNKYVFKYAGSMLLNNNSKGKIDCLLNKVINPETFEISKDVEKSDCYSYIKK